jgi:hypothetical protein
MNVLADSSSLIVLMRTGIAVWGVVALWWLWQAEQGRQKDMVRRTYLQAPELSVDIIIPLLHLRDSDELDKLLQALSQQQTDLSWIQVHIVSTLAPVPLPDFEGLTVRWWQAPLEDVGTAANPSQLQVWASHRLMASQAPDLFVYLQPGDRVRPDFLTHLITKAYEDSVIQCYMATRPARQTDGWQRWQQTESRLKSRLFLSGNYHAKMGLMVQASGLAIKPSLLEKVPPGTQPDADWTQYGLRLLARGVLPGWAPHAVVFQAPLDTGWQGLHQQLKAQFQALSLAASSAGFVFSTGLPQGNWPLVHGWFALLCQGLAPVGVGLALGLLWLNTSLAGMAFGVAATVGLLALLIARIPLAAAVGYGVGRGIFALLRLVAWPLVLFERVHQQRALAQQLAGQRQPHTRLNEALAPATNTLLDNEAGYHSILDDMVAQHDEAAAYQAKGGHFSQDDQGLRLDSQQTHTVVLSYGQRSVTCDLVIHCNWQAPTPPSVAPPVALYHLTLTYKTYRFQTQAHPGLITAYDELADKLTHRGFALKACGGCAYFYQDDEALPLAQCAYGLPGPNQPPSSANAQGEVSIATASCVYFEDRFASVTEDDPNGDGDPTDTSTSHVAVSSPEDQPVTR